MEKDTKFSVRARIKSVTHATRGLGLLFKNEHNFRVQVFFALLALYLGCILHISHIEWLFIIVAIFFVLVTEALNSALEIDINLTSPEYHPFARDTKDVAAAAVVLAILCATLVGVVIFLPKILPALGMKFW